MASNKRPAKRYNPRKFQPSVTSHHKALFRNSREITSEADITALLLPVYAWIDALRDGTLNGDNYISLVEHNCAGWCLAKRLWDDGTPDTKALMAANQVKFEDAAEAIARIGFRRNRIGKFVVTGDELRAIRSGATLLDQLVSVSSKGQLIDALLAAEGMVVERLGIVNTGAIAA